MNKEILMVAEAVSNEKGVSEDIIFEAIELALATATKKRYDEDADILVTIDRESGDYVTKRRWLVMPDTELALLGTQFTTEEAAEVNTALQPGDYHEEVVENVDFGRIAAQTANLPTLVAAKRLSYLPRLLRQAPLHHRPHPAHSDRPEFVVC